MSPDTNDHGEGSEGGGETNPTQKRRLQQRLDVSEEVLADAVELYQTFRDSDAEVVHDRALPIAVLYIAIRQNGVPRQIDELAEVANVSPRRLYRTARAVGDTLHQGIPPSEPELYVGRLADQFDVASETETAALRVLATAKTDGYHVGRKPAGVAAAALYAVAVAEDERPDITQRALSEAAGVHIKTVRENYKELPSMSEHKA
ncbi:transcription initiation factor TFIIB [Halovenus aranensis]|jgi:transcription initiation factor TFIIB|uniref:Transcription initiation factor TFIIB n=1 Tax=Halovenus aranensis TaxID=890420 RepID=A0A1G8W1W1_9EURY|nr:hypothetical protein [Halovenus aranensis]SDJ72374.1 transcription initiation factor TFIIB [Halovenus aranensis]